MNNTNPNIALLAPVPLQHLESGIEVCKARGKVAFGSRAWEVFKKLDTISNGLPIDVYFFASWSGIQSVRSTTWHGVYIRHVESVGGAHPDGMMFRPASTAGEPQDSAVFWEVANLRRLPSGEQIPTGEFVPYGKSKPYKTNFNPEKPLLVEHP